MIGFYAVFGIKGGDSGRAEDVVNALLEECLKPNHLVWGLLSVDRETYGLIICTDGVGAVTAEQRQAVTEWMSAREDVERLRFSELTDINHSLEFFYSQPGQDT